MNWVRIITVAALGCGLAFGCGSDDSNKGKDQGSGDGGPGGAAGNAGSTTGGAGTGGAATGGAGTGGGGAGGAGTGGMGTGGMDASTGGVIVTDGGPDGDAGPQFQCGTFGEICTLGSECCSLECDSATGTCTNPLTCVGTGASCTSGTDCCSLRCDNGSCSTSCLSDGATCTSDSQCCGASCDNGLCTPLNVECRTSGNSCATDSDCCSNYCVNGTCELQVSFCTQFGDICTGNEECCTANCNIAAGETVGTCGDAPTGASNCGGKVVDGAVCGTCGDCCSRLCAPYGPTGKTICQPASGCHVNGDFCRTDNDCCGAPDTGLPGEGNVTCDKADGATIGVCRNPNGCTPQGNVCHYTDADYTCNVSSSRANCCEATGFSATCMPDPQGVLRCQGFGQECPVEGEHCSTCQLDDLGVPRCQGLGECRLPGETCSSSADCCNDLPCVPDDQGVLRCLIPPESGPACVPAGGSCTINADCCVGTICIRPVGSTQGVCGNLEPPEGGTTVCAEYGQSCAVRADCCNADVVDCIGGICKINN